MKEGKEIEKIEEGETNEDFEEIDEIIEKYKDIDLDDCLSQFPFPADQVDENQLDKDKEIMREKFLEAITNNELPETFYEGPEKRHRTISDLFSKLELMEITKYNKKMAEYSKKPNFGSFGLSPYERNYDGETICKGDVFRDYDIEEKGAILQKNKDLVIWALDALQMTQSARLYMKSNNTQGFIGNSGVKAARVFVHYPVAKEYLSKDTHERANELNEEFMYTRGEDLLKKKLPHEDVRKIVEKRFPTEESFNKEMERLKNKLLEISQVAITEIKQKMKENYEKPRKEK